MCPGQTTVADGVICCVLGSNFAVAARFARRLLTAGVLLFTACPSAPSGCNFAPTRSSSWTTSLASRVMSRSSLVRDAVDAFLRSRTDRSVAEQYSHAYPGCGSGVDQWGDLDAWHKAAADARAQNERDRGER